MSLKILYLNSKGYDGFFDGMMVNQRVMMVMGRDEAEMGYCGSRITIYE